MLEPVRKRFCDGGHNRASVRDRQHGPRPGEKALVHLFAGGMPRFVESIVCLEWDRSG